MHNIYMHNIYIYIHLFIYNIIYHYIYNNIYIILHTNVIHSAMYPILSSSAARKLQPQANWALR